MLEIFKITKRGSAVDNVLYAFFIIIYDRGEESRGQVSHVYGEQACDQVRCPDRRHNLLSKFV